MIWNPGLLPQGWTLTHLTAKHASYPFNPDIANVFFRTPQTPEMAPKASVETPKTSVETPKASVKTSVKIIECLERNPEMTLAQVASEVGRSTRAVELATSKLVKAGRLRYVGPKKGGRWDVLK